MSSELTSKSAYDALPSSLRSDVRRLGTLLGNVIAADRGEEFVATIEEIRSLAKESRSTEAASWDRLEEKLRSLSDDELVGVTRAFNQFLNLANLAEQNHYAEEGTRRFDDDWGNLTAIFGDSLRGMLESVSIELVLTAHPTEVLRRTLIRKYDSMIQQLSNHQTIGNDASLLRLISEAWHTDEIRQQRPTPVDEAKWGFAVVENSLWEAVPDVLRSIDEKLVANGQPPLALDVMPFRFASWMGGDRDGNPHVTAETTNEVLRLARWMSADLFLRDVETLNDSLSMTACNTALRERIGAEHEPYRAVLKQLRERLRSTRDWAEGIKIEEGELLLTNQELLGPLQCCYDSLMDCGMQTIADGKLRDTIRKARCFGVNLISMDIRQHADRHTQVFEELVAHYQPTGRSFTEWSEQEKTDYLIRELTSKRPLFPRYWQPSADVAEVLATFRLVASVESVGLSNYIISMATQPSDVLQVALLMKECEVQQPLPIVPLFETLADLNEAGNVLNRLLALAPYQQLVQAHDSRQQVMIGYSDSAKDAGQLAAAWAQYRAQEDLLDVADAHDVKLTLFHGRGGAIGRGGGPAHQAILSQPPGAVAGNLRVTEQGEMIRFKLGTPQVAFETLTRYLSATLEATHSPAAKPDDELREAMEAMAGKSVKAYRGIVGSQAFVRTFDALTPEKELAALAIGSRPNRRKKTTDVFSLRAIPWVFAWTQVRLMLPAWLGTNVAVDFLRSNPELATKLLEWPFFKMQIELLEMMLAKAEPEIVRYYAHRLTRGEQHELVGELLESFHELKASFLDFTNATELLTQQLELKESLQVRNTYLDPLHLLQAELLYRHRHQHDEDDAIIRSLKVTMAGIASGLRNTG